MQYELYCTLATIGDVRNDFAISLIHPRKSQYYVVCANFTTPVFTQIESNDHKRKVDRLRLKITELAKVKASLERKLKESNDERDVLAIQNATMHATKNTNKVKLEGLKREVEIAQEHVSHLTDTVVTQTDEIYHLQEKLKTVEEELEVTKILVSS